MTQNSDPNKKAVAERDFGVLKQEFMTDKYIQGVKATKQIVKESVAI